MAQRNKIIIVILISLSIILFFMSIYFTVDEKMPRNAIVVTTIEDKYYHSIHFDFICVEGKTAEVKTLGEALSQGYRPHPYCQDLGYFKGNRRFYFHQILSKMGVQINSRWDKQGNWLW